METTWYWMARRLMNDGKSLKRSGRGPLEALSRYLSVWTDENHETLRSGLPVCRLGFKPRTSRTQVRSVASRSPCSFCSCSSTQRSHRLRAATDVPQSVLRLARRRHRSKELKIRIIRGRGDGRSNKWRGTPVGLVFVFVDMVTPSVSSARASNCISFSITWRIEDVLRREGSEKQDEFSSRPSTEWRRERLASVNSFLCVYVRSSTAQINCRHYVNCCGLLLLAQRQLETLSSGTYSAL
jgi:hypothetical protein